MQNLTLQVYKFMCLSGPGACNIGGVTSSIKEKGAHSKNLGGESLGDNETVGTRPQSVRVRTNPEFLYILSSASYFNFYLYGVREASIYFFKRKQGKKYVLS